MRVSFFSYTCVRMWTQCMHVLIVTAEKQSSLSDAYKAKKV